MNTALITGGSKGFGLALAESLVADGWSVVIDGRNPDALDEAVTRLRGVSNGQAVRGIVGDVADPNHRDELARAVGDDLDLLVNNASTLGPSPQPNLADYPMDDYRRVVDVNVVAPLALIQKVLPVLRRRRGTLVDITSDAGVEGYAGWGGYGSSKAALEQLSNVLAAEEVDVHVYWFDPGDMGLAEMEGVDPPDVRLIVVPRGGYEVLEDWGELIGLKGSGSNSVVIDDAFLPADHVVPVGQLMGESPLTTNPLPGGAIHDNPMYSGGFMGFAIGELTVVQVGAARAMLDEYEEMLGDLPIVSMSGNVPTKRYTDHDYQRCFGMALGWVDAAHGIMMRAGEIYMEMATKAFKAGRPVTSEDHWRLYGMIQTADKLSWEAGELLFRTAGSAASLDGRRMQRYWRDLCAFRSNSVHQFDFRSRAVTQARFGLPVERF